MNLGKEIDEFKLSFRKGNALTKVVMIVGFLLTLSSLTELSSKVIAWKGFILEGLFFYKTIFVGPIIQFSSIIGLTYSENEIHAATVLAMCIIIGMRVEAVGQQVAYRKISETHGKEVKPNLLYLWIVAIFAPLFIWVGYGFTSSDTNVFLLILFSFLYPVFLVLPKMIMYKFFDFEFFERDSFSYFKSYYIYIMALLLIICIFAGINSGLEVEPV